MRTCSIDDCARKHVARGWCGKHYQRWTKHGDPTVGPDRPPTCSIDGCARKHEARGWCKKHHARWLNHGDPNHVEFIVGDDEARFWSYVDVGHPLGCWEWFGAKTGGGYGNFRIGGARHGRNVPAHRHAYELLMGQIPTMDGAGNRLVLDHLCRNRACVNPDHVEVTTNRENILRGYALSAQRARQTVCVRGHPFTRENTFVQWNGARGCVTCRRTRRSRALGAA